MRKAIAIALCAILCLLNAFAFAQPQSAFTADDYVTLGELRIQAMDGWHETYTAKGRQVIVNATVYRMPQTDQCPVIQIETLGLAEDDSRLEKYHSQTNLVVDTGRFGVSAYAVDDSLYCDKNDKVDRNLILYDQELSYINGEQPTENANDCDLSYQQFINRVSEHLTDFAGLSLENFWIDSVRVWGLEYKAQKKNGKLVRSKQRTTSGGYSINARQLFEGIAVFEMYSDDTPRIAFYETYSNENNYGFGYHLSQQIAVLNEDIPLLSFNAIRRSLEAIINEGYLRSVDEIEFGYQILKTESDTFVLLPVWRVLGGYSRDANSDKNVLPYYDPRDTDGSLSVPSGYDYLYINAQTAELVPTYNVAGHYNNNRTLPAWKVLTWNEVK